MLADAIRGGGPLGFGIRTAGGSSESGLQHFLYFLPLPQGHGSLRPMRWYMLHILFPKNESIEFRDQGQSAPLTKARV